jgi:hypothetical protein
VLSSFSRREWLTSLLALPVLSCARDEWISLFDGRTLDGWKANEHAATFSVADGQIVAEGPRSHLFYVGGGDADFKNFELRAEVMSRPGANSGIFFHTALQPEGWPEQGFEVQVANTHQGEGNYRERKKTGSLYGVRNVYKAMARDDEWFEMHIVVRGKRVEIAVNGTTVVDFVEPDPPVQAPDTPGRILGHGTFALQGHDPHSRVAFRNIRVKPLPDDVSAGAVEGPVADDVYRKLLAMGSHNLPLVDYHVHLKGGLTLEQALQNSRRLGIGYGIALNCGVGFPAESDAAAEQFLTSLEGQPVFAAMQAEGREWVTMFSTETVAKFDYVFTDAMTFTDDSGKRMRLWIPEEVGEIPDPERFMKMYVDRIVGVLNQEPIDIFVNPTFLPDAIAADYDRLWTPQRMQQVIEAAVRNEVAIEINNRYRLPSATFLQMAKQAGAKFAFGTNNTGPELGRLEYSVEMVEACGLQWHDIFVPKARGEKAIERRGVS